MPTKYTKEQLLHKKIADYGFLIAFFFIFSFFIFVAIKPNLETAFKLKKELTSLKAIDENYNNAINKIIEVQSIMEDHRDDLPLLDEAVPSSPNVHALLNDIQKTASQSGLPISSLSVVEVKLQDKTSAPATRHYKVSIQSSSQFDVIYKFMTTFLAQRRLKMIESLDASREMQQASSSGELAVTFDIQGFYL